MSNDNELIDPSKIKVIYTDDQSEYITPEEADMDYRFQMAVKFAIEKAKVCKKPIARYDKDLKKAYLEYPDGRRDYDD